MRLGAVAPIQFRKINAMIMANAIKAFAKQLA